MTLTRCLRLFVLLWLAAAMPAAAHHAGDDQTTITDVAGAPVITLTGSVDALTVIDRVNAKTERYPILRQVDGGRVALRGDAVQAIKAGAQVSVTGSQTGTMFTVSGVEVQANQPMSAPAAPAVQAQVTGRFMVAHADDFETGTSRFFYQVFDDSGGVTEIAMPFLPSLLATGMRVVVLGSVATDGVSIDPSTITIESAPLVLGTFPVTTNYIVLPIKFPNADGTWPADPFTPASLNTAVFGALPTKSAKEFYKEASFSQQQLAGITADDSGPSGTFPGGAHAFLKSAVPKPATCDISVIASAAANAARAVGYPIDVNGNPTGAYTGLLYVFNNVAGCGWAGLAYVGWPRAYSNNTSALWVIGHELGHNFGLLHAGSLRCTGAVLGCGAAASVAEYGDPFSSMGNSGNTGHFNASQKDILGWITPSMTKNHAGGTAIYTLYPIETGGFATYAVRIPTANTSRTYSIEYRQPVGVFDAFVKPPSYPNAGAQIRLEYPFEKTSGSDDTELLDMTPATGSFGDAALLAGQTYTDSIYGVSISVLTATASSMTVQVTSPAGTTASTVTQTTSLTPAAYAAPVTFTATVAVAGVAPTGQVNFTEAGGAIAGCAPAPLTATAPYKATCTTSQLAPGTHSIVAIYAGDGTYKVSTAATALSQVINKAASSVTLASSLNPSPAGGSVTLTATVTGVASPTGAVNFKDGATSITGCNAVALTGSGLTKTAACTTSALASGSRSITAAFAGDAINAASTSPVMIQGVGLSSSTTVLASSGNPSLLGSSVTFTATVTGNAPTGPVNFTDGGTSLAGCATVALSGGIATCTAPSLSAGMHNIVATYAGDSANVGSTSTMVAQAVTVNSTTTVTTSLTPQNQGKLVTFTATVTGAAPTGSVDFQDGGTSITNCNMAPVTGSGNSRTATCMTTTLAFGTHSIVAVYSGDIANVSSSSTAITQDISATAVGTPTLQIIYSRKTHPAAGTFDLPLAP